MDGKGWNAPKYEKKEKRRNTSVLKYKCTPIEAQHATGVCCQVAPLSIVLDRAPAGLVAGAREGGGFSSDGNDTLACT